MDELLKPSSIVRTAKKEAEIDFLRESNAEDHPTGADPKPTPQHNKTPATAEDVLEVLKREPDYDALISALTFLSRHETDRTTFPSIRLPSPLSAQLVQVLVSEITPNYWTLLIEDVHQTKNSGLKLLLYCLSSITAVNAILVRLKALTQEAKPEATTKTKRPDISLNLGILLDLLARVLHGDDWLLEAYRVATSGVDSPARSRPRLQEIVATFGGGRIISLGAEAEEIAKANGSNKAVANNWPADPLQYTQWLGRNIVKLMLANLTPEETRSGSDLFAKALRLGHAGKMPWTPCSRPRLTSTRWTDQAPPSRACSQTKG
jgi:telomere length regulation protein